MSNFKRKSIGLSNFNKPIVKQHGKFVNRFLEILKNFLKNQKQKL